MSHHPYIRQVTFTPAQRPSRTVQVGGRTFLLMGYRGDVAVYEGQQCLVFGLATLNDAENWACQLVHGEGRANG